MLTARQAQIESNKVFDEEEGSHEEQWRDCCLAIYKGISMGDNQGWLENLDPISEETRARLEILGYKILRVKNFYGTFDVIDWRD